MARRVQYPNNVKVCKLNKANLAGVGQNGSEPPGSMHGSSENIKKDINVLLHPYTGPHLHRGSSQPQQPTSCANNVLCPCAVCETHRNPAVYFSWAGQPLWSSQKTITLNLHKKKRKTRFH